MTILKRELARVRRRLRCTTRKRKLQRQKWREDEVRAKVVMHWLGLMGGVVDGEVDLGGVVRRCRRS